MSTRLPPATVCRSDLHRHGLRRRDIDSAVASGRLIRARRDRYLPGDAHPDLIRAASLGGRLDCVSLLRAIGVFVLSDSRLHLQVEPHSSGLPVSTADVVRHWRPTSLPGRAAMVTLVDAIAAAVRCQEPRAAVATIDSAWHLGVIDEEGVNEVFHRLPRRHRRLRALVDGSAESGAESLMRLILRSIGCAVETQVVIDGVGRVDFLVDGWLIVECDSRAHHEGWAAQKRDRRRDLTAAALGFTTVRPLAEDIYYRRDMIREMVADALRLGQ